MSHTAILSSSLLLWIAPETHSLTPTQKYCTCLSNATKYCPWFDHVTHKWHSHIGHEMPRVHVDKRPCLTLALFSLNAVAYRVRQCWFQISVGFVLTCRMNRRVAFQLSSLQWTCVFGKKSWLNSWRARKRVGREIWIWTPLVKCRNMLKVGLVGKLIFFLTDQTLLWG